MDSDDDDDDEAPILVDMATRAQPSEDIAATNEDDTMEELLPPCPVTILSGFLGSGKTTLIQYILKSHDHGKRIAVIENEFGEGLAVETMIARDGLNSDSLQEFIELPNGCMCCTVKDSLVATLESLVEKKKDLDYILIEASGMANPGPIASVFWLDEALESRLQLDGIVTLVDANRILDLLSSTEEASQQIAYADRLLINKIDCLPPDGKRLDTITQTLRRLHPTAPMLTTTFSQVPNLDWILNANCFGGASRLEELDLVWNNAAETTTDPHGPDHDHHQNHHHAHSHDHHHDHNEEECNLCQKSQPPVTHKHTEAIKSLAFQQNGSLSLSKLNAWLAEILWPQQDESDKVLTSLLHDPSKIEAFSENRKEVMQIYRIKGIVSVTHDASHVLEDHEKQTYTVPVQDRWLDRRRYIVQAVHDLWEVHPGSDNLLFEQDEDRVGKIVIIGKYLPKEKLEHGFRSCFVELATTKS